MQLLQHIELSSAQASITFSNIPGTYTDLYLVTSLRASTTSAGNQALLTINGSTANFTYRLLFGSGTLPGSDGGSFRNFGAYAGSGDTASTFGNQVAYFPNYTANAAKSISWDSVYETNATAAYQMIGATLYNSTTAISSISFAPASGDWVQYSSATLYGILAGSDGIVAVS